ncbi:MAG: Crp/Fnr family transcriptional regulator [Clostridia bacterium]
MTKLEILLEINIFKDISKEYYEAMISGTNLKKYHKGASVYNETEECKNLDIIISGSLISHALSEKGEQMAMFVFKKNSIIGANLLFSTKNEYPYNIYALSDCEVLHINKETIDTLLHDYYFVKNFIVSLSQNSQGLNEKIAMFSKKSLRDNLKKYLEKQALLQNSNTILLPITKKELADLLCVRRPSLFREIKTMQEEELIRVDNKSITILYLN